MLTDTKYVFCHTDPQEFPSWLSMGREIPQQLVKTVYCVFTAEYGY